MAAHTSDLEEEVARQRALQAQDRRERPAESGGAKGREAQAEARAEEIKAHAEEMAFHTRRARELGQVRAGFRVSGLGAQARILGTSPGATYAPYP